MFFCKLSRTSDPNDRNDENRELHPDVVTKHAASFQPNFSSGNGIFQQDNAPCHKYQATLAFLQDNQIEVMDWPPYSPDLNPIENLWAILKRKIERVPRQTKEAVVNRVRDSWNMDLMNAREELSASMPHRIRACIESKGGPTGY